MKILCTEVMNFRQNISRVTGALLKLVLKLIKKEEGVGRGEREGEKEKEKERKIDGIRIRRIAGKNSERRV